MRQYLISAAAVLCFALQAFASTAELQPGVQYHGGTRVASAELGVSFVIPQDWLGGLPEGEEVFVMGSNTEPGLLLVVADEVGSMDEALAFFAEPLDLGDGVVLASNAAAKASGDRITASWRGTSADQVLLGQAEGRLLKTGVGIAFVSVGFESDRDLHSSLIGALAQSLEVREPVVSGRSASEWEAYLRGWQLTYLKVGDSTVERKINLCADGTYTYSGSTKMSSDGFFMHTPHEPSQGTWELDGGTLELTATVGQDLYYDLQFKDGDLLLNDTRYWREYRAQCR